MSDLSLEQRAEQAGREAERRENITLAYQLYEESKRQEEAASNGEERIFWTAVSSAYAAIAMKLQSKGTAIEKADLIVADSESEKSGHCKVCGRQQSTHVLSIDRFGTVVAGINGVGEQLQVCLSIKHMRSQIKLLERTWQIITSRDAQIEKLKSQCANWKAKAKAKAKANQF